MPFLYQNHGLTLWKNVNFSAFSISCFFSLERRFFDLEYHKRHFPGLYCLKKKLKKWPFLDQNHGLTPFEKCEFFDFLIFLFLQSKKAFFRSRISQNTFSFSISRKKKKLEKWPFLDQNHGITLLENVNFSTF